MERFNPSNSAVVIRRQRWSFIAGVIESFVIVFAVQAPDAVVICTGDTMNDTIFGAHGGAAFECWFRDNMQGQWKKEFFGSNLVVETGRRVVRSLTFAGGRNLGHSDRYKRSRTSGWMGNTRGLRMNDGDEVGWRGEGC